MLYELWLRSFDLVDVDGFMRIVAFIANGVKKRRLHAGDGFVAQERLMTGQAGDSGRLHGFVAAECV